jgi:hypothetical protein
MPDCGVCQLHGDDTARQRYEISRSPLWILRHHPDPAPLPGWLLLDARRHLAGPIAFTTQEAAAWGGAVQQAPRLVHNLTGCDRVYAIAFGEGARHLHLPLIRVLARNLPPRPGGVADLYRAVAHGERLPAEPEAVRVMVGCARASHLTFQS